MPAAATLIQLVTVSLHGLCFYRGAGRGSLASPSAFAHSLGFLAFFSARAERGELRENCETAPTTRGPYGQSFSETVQYSAEVIAR
jgi:hypothetical protein